MARLMPPGKLPEKGLLVGAAAGDLKPCRLIKSRPIIWPAALVYSPAYKFTGLGRTSPTAKAVPPLGKASSQIPSQNIGVWDVCATLSNFPNIPAWPTVVWAAANPVELAFFK